MNTQIVQYLIELIGVYTDGSMPDWVSQLKLTGEYADDSVFWFSTGVISPSARAVSSIGRLYSTRIPIAFTLSLMMLWCIQRKTKQNKETNNTKLITVTMCVRNIDWEEKNKGPFHDLQPYPPF